jgi:hypothetical protein
MAAKRVKRVPGDRFVDPASERECIEIVRELRAEVADYKSALNRRDFQINGYITELAVVEARRREISLENSKLEAAVAAVTDELSTVKAVAEACAESNQEMKLRLETQARELLERSNTIGSQRQEIREQTALRQQTEAAAKETELQFAELKQHIAVLQTANAEMVGYIARAQEDDIAREELLTTGDPDGETVLVPKRKHRVFSLTSFSHLTAQSRDEFTGGIYQSTDGASGRRRTKHWVTYGDRR